MIAQFIVVIHMIFTVSSWLSISQMNVFHNLGLDFSMTSDFFQLFFIKRIKIMIFDCHQGLGFNGLFSELDEGEGRIATLADPLTMDARSEMQSSTQTCCDLDARNAWNQDNAFKKNQICCL